MFYATKQDKYIVEGTAFELDGVQYPAVWLNQSTAEEKAAIGLVEVRVIGAPENPQYYWVSETLEGPSLTYTNTPKDLAQVKETATSQTNTTAYSLLFPSDWMVTKAVETQTPVPEDWNAYRASVREQANVTKAAIIVAESVDEVASIMSSIQWPYDPNYKPVVEDTPAEESTNAPV